MRRWSSSTAVKATVANVLAVSRLAENRTASADATNETDTSMNALEAVDLVAFIIGVAGIVLNVSAFTAVYRTHMRNRALRLGLLSLACSDLLLALSIVVIRGLDRRFTQYSLTESSALSQYCAKEVLWWMVDVGSSVQLLTIALLAVQQFVALRWPLRTANGMSSRSSAYALTVLWLVSALLGLAQPIAITVSTEHHPLMRNWTQTGLTRFCYQLIIYYSRNDDAPYDFDLGQSKVVIGFADLGFATMCTVLAVLIGSYGYVAHIIRRTRPGDGCGASAAEMATALRRYQDRKRVPIVTATVTLLCLAGNLPLCVNNTLCVTVFTECSFLVSKIATTIMALTSAVDPLIYTLRLPAVRQVALSPLSRCHSCLTKSNKRGTVELSCDDPQTQQTTTTHLDVED